MAASPRDPSIVLLGLTGTGKSTVANRLLGVDKFKESEGFASCTSKTEIEVGPWFGNSSNPWVKVIDTPGLDDSQGADAEHMREFCKTLRKEGQVNAFVLVFNFQSMGLNNSNTLNFLKLMTKTIPNLWTNAFVLVTRTMVAKNLDARIEKQRSAVLETIFSQVDARIEGNRVYFVDCKGDGREQENTLEWTRFASDIFIKGPVSVNDVKAVGDLNFAARAALDAEILELKAAQKREAEAQRRRLALQAEEAERKRKAELQARQAEERARLERQAKERRENEERARRARAEMERERERQRMEELEMERARRSYQEQDLWLDYGMQLPYMPNFRLGGGYPLGYGSGLYGEDLFSEPDEVDILNFFLLTRGGMF